MSARLLGQASTETIRWEGAGDGPPQPELYARLEPVLAVLLGALGTWEVARALATVGAARVGAAGATVAALRDGGLEVVLADGEVPGALVPLGRGARIASGPLADAAATLAPVWVERSDGPAALAPGVATVGALPLVAPSGTAVGALALEWSAPPSPADRAAARVLAALASPALQRAMRHDAAREAHARAEVRAREARRHARQQEHLMAVAGHDLRTPLQTVIMGARLLTQQGLLTPAQAVTAGRMARSAERAAGIIRDLLDLGRVRQGLAVRLAVRGADLGALAHAAVLELEQAYPERVITCAVEGDAAGAWDAGRLSRVVTNLAQNALEHGGPRARVEVAVRGEDPDTVRLTVHHDGPPMPPDRVARVLEPGGGHAGLGLAIVGEIVRAHGGALSARSSSEDGTVFEVALPRRVPA